MRHCHRRGWRVSGAGTCLKPKKWKRDSRVADVNSGEDLVEVLCREAVEAPAVGQELVELLDGNLAAGSRNICRWLLLLFGRTHVLLHASSCFPELLLDESLPQSREPRFHVHCTSG